MSTCACVTRVLVPSIIACMCLGLSVCVCVCVRVCVCVCVRVIKQDPNTLKVKKNAVY